MQDKLTQGEKRAAETDLIISTKKTKVLKFNTNNQADLNVNHRNKNHISVTIQSTFIADSVAFQSPISNSPFKK